VPSVSYDAAGNIISDGVFTFVYNQNSRLAQVKKARLLLANIFMTGLAGA